MLNTIMNFIFISAASWGTDWELIIKMISLLFPFGGGVNVVNTSNASNRNLYGHETEIISTSPNPLCDVNTHNLKCIPEAICTG